MGRKADLTKHRVERAALGLFVARGVAETTTKEIAAAAEIAEGTIYRYFDSKEVLAHSLFIDHYLALAKALEDAHQQHKAFRAKVEAIVRTYCRMADLDWLIFAYHLLTQHQHLQHLPAGSTTPVDVIREVIAAAMRRGDIPKRNVDVLTGSALGVVLQPAFQKVYGRLSGPLSDHIDLFIEAVWAVLHAKPR